MNKSQPRYEVDQRWASISSDERFRYSLGRTFKNQVNPSGAKLLFVMLNPSTADGQNDDPTIRRCLGFAWDWNFYQVTVGNVYAYRATDPKDLIAALARGEDCHGPSWEHTLGNLAFEADTCIVAWGRNGASCDRARAMKVLCDHHRGDIYCLGKTLDGSPKHPLYLAADTKREWYR